MYTKFDGRLNLVVLACWQTKPKQISDKTKRENIADAFGAEGFA